MAIKEVKLMHKCFHEQLCIGIARMKEDKETEEDDKHEMEKQQSGHEITKSQVLAVARAYRPMRLLLPDAIDELRN